MFNYKIQIHNLNTISIGDASHVVNNVTWSLNISNEEDISLTKAIYTTTEFDPNITAEFISFVDLVESDVVLWINGKVDLESIKERARKVYYNSYNNHSVDVNLPWTT